MAADYTRTVTEVSLSLTNLTVSAIDNKGGYSDPFDTTLPEFITNVAVLNSINQPLVVGPVTDTYFSSVQLLLHMNGTQGSTVFTDSSPFPLVTTTFGNAQINTTDSKFGGASGLFDGSGDYVDIAATSGFDFGLGDFTVEFWVKTTFNMAGVTPYRRVIAPQVVTNIGEVFQIAHAGSPISGAKFENAIELITPLATGSTVSTMQAINDNQWHHVAFARSSGTVKAFLDGVLKDSAADTNDYSVAGVNGFRLAGRGDLAAGTFFSGKLDDFRITKGVARYTGNFTPPSAQFPDQGDVAVTIASALTPDWRKPYRDIG
jgi:hypothetical protein